jgi:hypothetical protein
MQTLTKIPIVTSREIIAAMCRLNDTQFRVARRIYDANRVAFECALRERLSRNPHEAGRNELPIAVMAVARGMM